MPLRVLVCLSCLLLLFSAASTIARARAKDEKLKPEELIARHLESIGSPEALKAIKTRTVQGAAHVVWRVGGQANLDGQGTILSEGVMIRAAFRFSALAYPGEQFVSDGNKVGVEKINPRERSNLGDFIYLNDEMLRDGLLFGTLSTSWALLRKDAQPRLDLNGPKKIDGQSLYELKYAPKRGNGNVKASLYFDVATFRHVRSEFRAEIVPPRDPNADNRGGRSTATILDGAVSNDGERGETSRVIIIERFADFKVEDGLTLPHSYTLDFSVDSPRGGFVGTWTMAVNQVAHNRPIEQQLFSLN